MLVDARLRESLIFIPIIPSDPFDTLTFLDFLLV